MMIEEVLPGEIGGEEVMEGAVKEVVLLQTQTFSLAPSPKEMSTNNVVKKVRRHFLVLQCQNYATPNSSNLLLYYVSECEGITRLDLIQHW